jgi:hypothetical protein
MGIFFICQGEVLTSEAHFQDEDPEEIKQKLLKARMASGRKSFTSQVIQLLKLQRPKTGAASTQQKVMAFTPAVTKCPEPEYAEGIVECPASPSLRPAPDGVRSSLCRLYKRLSSCQARHHFRAMFVRKGPCKPLQF